MTQFAVPTQFEAEYRGIAGKGGSFERDGETIGFSDKCLFEFEDFEGVTQTIEMRVSKIDEVAEVDVTSEQLGKGDRVLISGVVRNGDRGAYLALQSFSKAGSKAKAAAAA